MTTSEIEELLAELAGDPTPKAYPRTTSTCRFQVGRCTSEVHTHPSPGMQRDLTAEEMRQLRSLRTSLDPNRSM